jgi:outer membrane protein TolC
LKIISFGIILVIISSFNILAQEEQVITLDQTLEMALKNDSQVIMARNNVEKAKLAVKQEVIKTWPQASVTDSYGDILENPIDPHTGEPYFTQFPNMLTITITDTIPSKLNLYGKKVPTTIEAAIWDRVNNEAQLEISQANVVYNTISLYLNALKAEKTVIYQEGVAKNSQTSLEIALQQLKLNQITKPAELKIENDYANAVYTLLKSKSDYDLALQQLGNQIGLKDVTRVRLVEPTLNLTDKISDNQQLKMNAIQKRLEMKQAEIAVWKAEQQLAQSQNQVLPDLNFGYTYRNSDGTESLTLSYSFLSGNITGNTQKVIGDKSYIEASNNSYRSGIPNLNELTLKLTWNLSFGIPQNQVQQSKLLLDNALSSGAQIQQGIEWEVDQADANHGLAIRKNTIAQQALAYYQKQLEIKQLQLKQGTVSQLDVDTAASDLFQAQTQAKSAEYDQFLAYQKLQMVIGNLYPLNTSLKK